MRKATLFVIPAALLLPGCIAKTAWDVATLPVKAVGQTADWATTSQSEADRNYGRRMRKAEAREGKERREWAKKCQKDPDCGPYDGYVAANDRKVH